MTTAKQIKRDYKNNLNQMLAEAKVWKENDSAAFGGAMRWEFYGFSDGSMIEFEFKNGKLRKAV